MGMGELRVGKDHMKQGGGKRLSTFTPFISWKEDDVKNLFFITPIDEVPKVLMHQWVKKQVPGEKPRYMTFMCRKDPAWRDESNGSCPLCDDHDLKPTERYAAIAIEVEPVLNGKRINSVEVKYNQGQDKEGNEVSYPAVGLVLQGPKFFSTLVAHDQKRDISELSWEVTREGGGLKTTYLFYPLEHSPDLDGVENLPDLKELLTYYGSQEKYDNDIDEFITTEDHFSKVGAEEKPKTPLSGVSNETSTGDWEQLKETLKSKEVESY